jgi:hypothetical protein
MVRGLQIRIRGDELSRRIAERIEAQEARVAALDERIRRRDGDLPFDVRVEDGLSTLAELKAEREQHSDRVCELSLVRESVIADELYILSKADLQLAGLMASEVADSQGDAQRQSAGSSSHSIVDGLKVTVDGADLQDLLDTRIETHRQRAGQWKRAQARTADEQTEDHPLVPAHLCEIEAGRHEWRARVLQFIRDRLDPVEAYRLGEVDLLFGELLPETPNWLQAADNGESADNGRE